MDDQDNTDLPSTHMDAAEHARCKFAFRARMRFYANKDPVTEEDLFKLSKKYKNFKINIYDLNHHAIVIQHWYFLRRATKYDNYKKLMSSNNRRPT